MLFLQIAYRLSGDDEAVIHSVKVLNGSESVVKKFIILDAAIRPVWRILAVPGAPLFECCDGRRGLEPANGLVIPKIQMNVSGSAQGVSNMDKRVIKKGMEALVRIDEDMANAVEQVGYPAPRLRPVGFETLFTAILSQQISTSASRAIRERVIALMDDVSAKSLLLVDSETLRSAGMSYRKIEYAKGLAEAIVEGRLDLQGMREQTDDEVISTITALRGFGLWSAEIYLMFSLRRRDVFPAGDLALRSSLGILKDMEGKLTPTQARQLVAHWSPWRSVGSLFLWHYYRGAPN